MAMTMAMRRDVRMRRIAIDSTRRGTAATSRPITITTAATAPRINTASSIATASVPDTRKAIATSRATAGRRGSQFALRGSLFAAGEWRIANGVSLRQQVDASRRCSLFGFPGDEPLFPRQLAAGVEPPGARVRLVDARVVVAIEGIGERIERERVVHVEKQLSVGLRRDLGLPGRHRKVVIAVRPDASQRHVPVDHLVTSNRNGQPEHPGLA